ncbi:MAG: AraC family transcriptional regulator [Reichenbachiella sp.]|uniref:AraC family transcriptional regulator n=2 Tax=Reichenbachiella sp. TaxID=2184521 RepID=UPI003263D972
MKDTCSYCDSLKMAIPGDNVCSVHGAGVNVKSSGNSFYIKSRKLASGQHVSRLTIRGVLDGYQHYDVGDKKYRLSPDNYLVVNKGEKYSSEINSVAPIESVIVAFGDDVINDVKRTLSESQVTLLDDPFDSSYMADHIVNGVYSQTPAISRLLTELKEAILSGDQEANYFENMHYSLMLLLVKNHFGMLGEIDELADVKRETRIEMHKRIRVAKDYMDSRFTQKLTLQEIASHSALSTCHFLRSFKQLQKITPYEYLTQARLKYAKYLLQNSDMCVQAVTQSCGFDSHSSFSRLFRKRFQVSPKEYRNPRQILAISA